MTDQQSTNKSINLTIRLNEQALEDLRKLANEKGMGITTLVRMWVLERLQKEHTEQYRVIFFDYQNIFLLIQAGMHSCNDFHCILFANIYQNIEHVVYV